LQGFDIEPFSIHKRKLIMTWKRKLTIVLCGCALWLYADQSARAQQLVPNDDKAPQATQKQDEPPATSIETVEAAPSADDFDSPTPPPGYGGLFPRRGDGDRYLPPSERSAGNQPPIQAGHAVDPASGRVRISPVPSGAMGPVVMPNDPFAFSPGPRDPLAIKEAELERQVQALSEEYRSVDDPRRPTHRNREELQKQIEKLVRDQFECRQARRQMELTRFEEQIKRLRDAIEKREKARDVIIDRRVKELLGQEDDLKF
jgi:hypothetical protein